MLTRNRFLWPTVAVTGAICSFLAESAAAGVAMAPHRAVYEMNLLRSEPASGIQGLSGRLAFELRGAACEGYTTTIRFVSEMQGRENLATTDIQSTAFESGDASAYRFVTRTHYDRVLGRSSAGVAERRDRSVDVTIDEPEPGSLRLGRDVMFPLQHIRSVIEAAQAGRRVTTAQVYDGGDDGRKLFDTTAVVGMADGGELPEAGRNALADIVSWPVTIAYFEGGEDGDGTPSYEFSYRLFENGVSGDIVLDYGDFAIEGRLASLEMLEPPTCVGR